MKSRKLILIHIILFSIFISLPAVAQMSVYPPEISQKIRALGMNQNPTVINAVREIYTPLQEGNGKDVVKITRDFHYGTDERHRLDVYEPLKRPKGLLPVLVFVHGGAFIGGDKDVAGTPFYTNIGLYFARNGLLTVLPTYRLAPKNKWPAATEDVASALKWVRENVETFGGDRNRIFIMGHSAGATHVAGYIFRKEFQLKEGDGLVGAILMSGTYDPASNPNKTYFGEDPSKYPAMASLSHVEGRTMPVFITFAELDPDFFHLQAAALFTAICKRDNACPAIKQLIEHNHMSEVYHINTRDESIGPDILEFIRSRRSN
jgi:acetyl esterase